MAPSFLPKTKMLAKNAGGKMVQCLACRRYCKIPQGMAGYCGVRQNEGGKLVLKVYCRPCAVWVDPVEKKPLFHFLPGTKIYSIGTFGCNFECTFCQNWDISQAPQAARQENPAGWKGYFDKLVSLCKELPPEKVVANAIANGCRSIAFTYNEPTIFTEYAIDVMKIARKKGLKGVYVTNGYESHECWDAIAPYIDAANIDLKAYNEKFYTQLCKVGPRFEPNSAAGLRKANDFELVKDSILYAKKKGIWVEVTTLLIPDWNDNGQELQAEAEWLASVDREMPWHVTAFHPDYKLRDKPPTPPQTLIRAREIGLKAGLRHIYCGNICGLAIEHTSGVRDRSSLRLEREYETTYCARCGKGLISRDGFSVMRNDLIAGKCKYCKKKASGIWK